ncbi:alpha/beta fold hydrolase [Ktedonobacter racemifer]|uniref:Alpha/beta hydrolase fold protein n=1 Tax=Ktedonobacter racemifer DSM 44963 TaxID=485913 RepID=D6U3D2_KTERA|nr:alpha/beta fold hydrolase [Ktedonobacter racemifer]EFH81136.1 alpha/beta hydrolase fold protein [Ktedonobacter racemifer DSM 44963]
MPFVTIPDGTRLYYEESGTGEPLLLVSGQGLDHTSWDGIRDDFTDRYRVIVFDHRGTGQSDQPTAPPYSTRGFAQDAIALLDHLGIARVHVYGYSMGGRVSQWLGIDHGQRVGALVLGATTPGSAHGVPRSAEVNALWTNPLTDPQEALEKIGALFYSPGWIASHLEVVKAALQSPPLPEYVRRLHYQASEGHDAWDLLPTISAPTLVLHGSEDRMNPPANAHLLAKRIPGAELSLIEGARHGYLIEFREEASRIVKAFLAHHPLS